MQHNQWRIQDLQTGVAKVERRRREDRGAEGAEEVGLGRGVPSPMGKGLGGGIGPSPKNFSILSLKMATFSVF